MHHGLGRRVIEPGTIVDGRYRVVGPIGGGGWGIVYDAEHTLTKRRVAIKVLREPLADHPEVLARFLREARAAAAIGHPNLCAVLDFGDLPSGAPYMVLERLDGRDLAAILEAEGPQPLARIAHVLAQACRALEAAHQKGIVHRDLKPENLFVTSADGDPCFVKVLDFGISKFREPSTDAKLTQTGAMMGTPRYMSPEQCLARSDVDRRADIFALGIILFRALSGVHPFEHESHATTVRNIVHEPHPPLATLRPDLPREIVELVDRMLHKDRDARPQRCAEIEAILSRYATIRTVTRTRPMVKILAIAIVVLALITSLAGGFGLFMFASRSRSPEPRAEGAPMPIAPIAEPPIAEDRDVGPTLHLTLLAHPEHAELFIDGVRVSNPFDGHIARGRHTFSARATGYEPREQTLTHLGSRHTQSFRLRPLAP